MAPLAKNLALATLLFGSWAAVSAEEPCATEAPAPSPVPPAPAPTPGVTTTGGLSVEQQVGIGVGAAAGAALVGGGIAIGVTHCEWGDCGTTTTPTIKTLTLTQTPPGVDCNVIPAPASCKQVGSTPPPDNNTTYFSGSPSSTQPVLAGLGLALLAGCLLLCCLALLAFCLCGGKKSSRKHVKPYTPLPVVAPEPVAAEPEVFVPPLLPFMAAPIMTTTAVPAMIAPPVTTARETVIAPPVMGPTFTSYEVAPAVAASVTTIQEAAAPAVYTGMTTVYETAPAVMTAPVTTYETVAAPAMMTSTVGYTTATPVAMTGYTTGYAAAAPAVGYTTGTFGITGTEFRR